MTRPSQLQTSARGVEEDVLVAVDLLTHRDGMTYREYVRNIASSGNLTAMRVKLNDLYQNLLSWLPLAMANLAGGFGAFEGLFGVAEVLCGPLLSFYLWLICRITVRKRMIGSIDI